MSTVGTVTSQGQPQKGQTQRSSNNFPNFDIPSGTSNLEWSVSVQGGDINSLRFDVMQDVSLGHDPTLLSNVAAGETAPVKTGGGTFESGGSYYIANPKDISTGGWYGDSFTVTVETA